MDFRLAQKQDLTPQMCQAILHDAETYCKENQLDRLAPWEILNIFINFCEGKITDPQFWVGLKDDELVGYMITQAFIVDKEPHLYIRQGYIEQRFSNNGVAGYCLEAVEKKAKATGYKYVSCKTYLNPTVYSRWIKRYGYGYNATEFRKEV
jgi:GNAT superfamily N-acetyltransferase